MTGNPAPPVTAQDAARTVAGHLAFLAEAQPASAHDAEIGNGWHGGFARDFATADGERVMVAALTRQQFADLAKTTRLARTCAFRGWTGTAPRGSSAGSRAAPAAGPWTRNDREPNRDHEPMPIWR
jgi:hypothetical protein